MVDVANDGCPILEPLVSESSTEEVELMELQEDLGLKTTHKSQSTIDLETSSRNKIYWVEENKCAAHFNLQDILLWITEFCNEVFKVEASCNPYKPTSDC